MADTGKQVRDYVRGRISYLVSVGGQGTGKAALAKLRRGIGSPPGDMPELWGMLLTGLPQELQSRSGAPSRGEWAIYTALTLYALHQQGSDPASEPMSRDGASLGRAARRLVSAGDEGAEERIWKRLGKAATAEDMTELAYHLRGLVRLLKAESIPLDYPRLAQDIYSFQFPEAAPGVRLRWGQDFYGAESAGTDNA